MPSLLTSESQSPPMVAPTIGTETYICAQRQNRANDTLFGNGGLQAHEDKPHCSFRVAMEALFLTHGLRVLFLELFAQHIG